MFEIENGELDIERSRDPRLHRESGSGPRNVATSTAVAERVEPQSQADPSVKPATPTRTSSEFTAILNLTTDLCVLIASTFVATVLSHRPAGVEFPEAVATSLMAVVIWIVASVVLRQYEPWAFEREAIEDAASTSVLIMAVTTFWAVVNLVLHQSAAVPMVPQFLLVFSPAVLGLRLLVFRKTFESDFPLHETVIIGVGPLGRATGEDLKRRRRHRVVGYLQLRNEDRSSPLKSRVLGHSDELEAVLRTTPVSEVYIAGDLSKHYDAVQAAIRTCEKFGVPFALPAGNFRFERARPVAGRAIADGYLHYLSVDLKPHQMAVKHLFDVVFASLALAILLPLFAVMAVLIKISSRGPVFFRQARVGLHGRPFRLLKFRSMVVNAEELKPMLEEKNERTGPVFKIRNDPRITPIGKFMRRHSIDELPQLINVLRGEMSIVGPRPPVPGEVVHYEPWQFRRLALRPGLTCSWQACRERHEISFEEWMYLDLQYIDHWSLARDFVLICKTVPIVLTGAGER